MKLLIAFVVASTALLALSVSAQAPGPSVVYSVRQSISVREDSSVANMAVNYMSDGTVRWEIVAQ